MTPLTRKQAETLQTLRDHQAEHGYMPSYRELARLLGLGVTAAWARVVALERAGALRRTGGPNGIVIHPE